MSEIYIDIHTHRDLPARTDMIPVRNIRMQDGQNLIPGKGWFSIGLHPWDSDHISLDLSSMDHFAGALNCFGIGECGIDRLRGADMAKQSSLFIKQAMIAETHYKPLIIHCVRAWQEMMSLKAELLPKVPWIIHGFRGNPELSEKLVEHGFYLSFGENIIHANNSAAISMKIVPIDRIFLETDNGPHTIEEVYRTAAEIKNLSLVELQTRLQQNFEIISGIHGTS